MKITEHFHEANIQSLQDVTPTVREFTLTLPSDAPPAAFHWQAGAHVQLNLLVNGKETTRHYSLLPPLVVGTLRIAVKRASPGRGGSAAMWELSVGNKLRVSEPLNQFTLDLSAPAYFLLAGGIGITPILGMAQMLAQRGANVELLYCASSAQEWAYWRDLDSALGDKALAIVGPATGLQERIARLPKHAQAYVCGPAGLLQAMQQAWSQAGRAPALLRYESFGAASSKAEAFKVLLPRHRLELEVPPESSLLDVLEMQGIAAMYGCRKGECGLCALPVLALQGEIEHHDVFLSAHEKQSNAQICVCVSRAKGCITLDTAYRPDATPHSNAKRLDTAPAH
jgi:ferredoxin-NADP reductase